MLKQSCIGLGRIECDRAVTVFMRHTLNCLPHLHPSVQDVDQDWAWQLLEQVSLSEGSFAALTAKLFGKE